MATYDAVRAVPGLRGGPVRISYDQRDVLRYAVGIGSHALRFAYERHPAFAVFRTFAIRWGGAGAPIDTNLVPNSRGPLNIDVERTLALLRPLPVAGEVAVRSRVIGIHPRSRGNGFVAANVEDRTVVSNAYFEYAA